MPLSEKEQWKQRLEEIFEHAKRVISNSQFTSDEISDLQNAIFDYITNSPLGCEDLDVIAHDLSRSLFLNEAGQILHELQEISGKLNQVTLSLVAEKESSRLKKIKALSSVAEHSSISNEEALKRIREV